MSLPEGLPFSVTRFLPSVSLWSSLPLLSLGCLEQQRGSMHAWVLKQQILPFLEPFYPWKRMIPKRLEKTGPRHPWEHKRWPGEPRSPFNLRVGDYLSLELLNRRAKLCSYYVLVSKPAGERQPRSHCQQAWQVGTPGAHVLPERQPSLTQFQHNIAWHSTAIRNFNTVATYKAVFDVKWSWQSSGGKALLLAELRGEATQGDCDLRSPVCRPSLLSQTRKAGFFSRMAGVGVAESEWNQCRRMGRCSLSLLL